MGRVIGKSSKRRNSWRDDIWTRRRAAGYSTQLRTPWVTTRKIGARGGGRSRADNAIDKCRNARVDRVARYLFDENSEPDKLQPSSSICFFYLVTEGGSTAAVLTLDTTAVDESRKTMADRAARTPVQLCSNDGKLCYYRRLECGCLAFCRA